MPSWAAMALRMKALLLGSLLRNSASSSSTLNATTAVLGGLRDIRSDLGSETMHVHLVILRGARSPRNCAREPSPVSSDLIFASGACERPGGSEHRGVHTPRSPTKRQFA